MKLTKAQRLALRKALHTLAKDGPVTEYGICHNLSELVVQGKKFIDTYTFVGTVSVTWPEVDKSAIVTESDGVQRAAYPITREYDENEYRLPYWEGAQLEKRMSLIKYLSDWLDNTTAG